MNRRMRYGIRTKIWVTLAVLCVLGIVLLVVREYYTVQHVTVEGNMHYTEEEIKELVMQGVLGDNSLYLSLKYRNQEVQDIPFIDAMDINILAPDTIHIAVYEKALAGFVRYMDTNMYFDREGYVVECSDLTTDGVPRVTGLAFDHMVLGERLPVADSMVFENIMDLTRLLDKYELQADNIFFHSGGEITIYFGEIKAALGDDSSQLEHKMKLLPQFLAKLEGEKGTLRMENLTEDKTDVSFRREE